MSLFMNANTENNQTNVKEDQEYYCEEDVKYNVDEELENSYLIIHSLQEKYGEKFNEEYRGDYNFIEDLEHIYWYSWVHVYLGFLGFVGGTGSVFLTFAMVSCFKLIN